MDASDADLSVQTASADQHASQPCVLEFVCHFLLTMSSFIANDPGLPSSVGKCVYLFLFSYSLLIPYP